MNLPNPNPPLTIGDRVQSLVGKRSACGRYFIGRCRRVTGTIEKEDENFTTGYRWLAVRFDGTGELIRVNARSVERLNALDRLAEIPE